MKYLESKCIKNLKRVKPERIIMYLGEKKLSSSNASVNRYYMALRSFFRWAHKTKKISEDVTQDISVPMLRQQAPRIPTVDEMQAILEQPDTSTESGLRDRAMLELLYSSGLRASELCALRMQDYTHKQIVISSGKRGKTRTVPLTDEANHWIEQYIEQYRGNTNGYLFLTQLNKPIRRQLLTRLVSHYAKKARVDEVTAHTLRHACATHLLDEGADLRLIQEILGHTSIASTQRYTHLSKSKMQSMFEQFHPRKREAI